MENEPQPQPRIFYPNKLVRDRIPELHRSEGWDVVSFQVEANEYVERLYAKLEEERTELAVVVNKPASRANRKSVIGEIVDVLTVQSALDHIEIDFRDYTFGQLVARAEKLYGIKMDEIEKVYEKKLERNGGFWTGAVLFRVAAGTVVAEEDPILMDYRKQAHLNIGLLSPPVER